MMIELITAMTLTTSISITIEIAIKQFAVAAIMIKVVVTIGFPIKVIATLRSK